MVSDLGIWDQESKDWGSWYLYIIVDCYQINIHWTEMFAERSSSGPRQITRKHLIFVLQVVRSDLSLGSGDACVPLADTNLHSSGPVGPVPCWAQSGSGWWGSSSWPPQGCGTPAEPRPGSAWATCLLNQWEVSRAVTSACSSISAFIQTLSQRMTATKRLRFVL